MGEFGPCPGGSVHVMATGKTSSPARVSAAARGDVTSQAVFVDLDRTLLRGASGLALSVAMHAEGLFEGRRSLPGEKFIYGLYDVVGESLPFMAMVRAAPLFVRGWPVEGVRRAGASAAPALAHLVQPYAPAVLAEHRAAGRMLVLATTSPVDLVGPFAELVGFDHVVGTQYSHADGCFTGGIDGDFVWGPGKLDRGATVGDRRTAWTWPRATPTPTASSTCRCCGRWAILDPSTPTRGCVSRRALLRWPIEHWDRPAGVPKVLGTRAVPPASSRDPPRGVPVRPLRHCRHRAHPGRVVR